MGAMVRTRARMATGNGRRYDKGMGTVANRSSRPSRGRNRRQPHPGFRRRWAGGHLAERSQLAGRAPGDTKGRLGRVEREDRNLILGELKRDRLVGVFKINYLGHEPTTIDCIVHIVLRESNSDRVFAGVDTVGPMQVADDLDDRKELR